MAVSDTEAPVSPEAYDRSRPVPSAWTVTFSWGRDWWVNQENGMCSEPAPMPNWKDIEGMVRR